MISWTKLLTEQGQEHDDLRFSPLSLRAPKIVVWNITKQCNLSCRHCYSEAIQTGEFNQLSHQEAKAFIKDLALLNVAVLLFSGGEPLLRKDIFDLAKYTRDQGIRAVLSTNGTLITQDIAKRIKQAGVLYAGISLDGTEETNDTFRRNKGAFRSALAGIRNCQDAGVKVGLRFTLTKYNFKDLPAIFELVERESIQRVCIYHLVYSGRGHNLSDKDLSHKETREVLELIWQKTTDFHKKGLKIEILTVDNHADGVWIYQKLKKCDSVRAQRALDLLKVQGGNSSGINIAAVGNDGDIYADQFLRNHSLGNIRQRKFSETWQDTNNGLLQGLRNRESLLKGRCQRCKFLAICNGNFRARAEAVFGNLWAEDPACYLTEEEIK